MAISNNADTFCVFLKKKRHQDSVRKISCSGFYTKAELLKMLKNKHIGEYVEIFKDFAVVGNDKLEIETTEYNGKILYKLKS